MVLESKNHYRWEVARPVAIDLGSETIEKLGLELSWEQVSETTEASQAIYSCYRDHLGLSCTYIVPRVN